MTQAWTRSRFGDSAMHACDEKAAPLSLQSCWHRRVLETMHARHLRRVSLGDLDLEHVGLDRARASPNGAATSVVAAEGR